MRGRRRARTDPGVHISGDLIAAGCPTVIIGDSTQCFTMRNAARRGTPFCEERAREPRRDDLDTHDHSAQPRPPRPRDRDARRRGAAAGRPLGPRRDGRRRPASKHELAGPGDDLPHERMSARFAVAYQSLRGAHRQPQAEPDPLAHQGHRSVARGSRWRSVAKQTLFQHCASPAPGSGSTSPPTRRPPPSSSAARRRCTDGRRLAGRRRWSERRGRSQFGGRRRWRSRAPARRSTTIGRTSRRTSRRRTRSSAALAAARSR